MRVHAGVLAPAMDVFQRDGNLVVRADMPGVKREDIDVFVEDNVLRISGQRKEEHEVKEKNYYRAERSYGEFARAIRLPEGAKAEEIKASFKDGVLEVVIASAAKPEPKPHQGGGAIAPALSSFTGDRSLPVAMAGRKDWTLAFPELPLPLERLGRRRKDDR